jgi:hypothetical protein
MTKLFTKKDTVAQLSYEWPTSSGQYETAAMANAGHFVVIPI